MTNLESKSAFNWSKTLYFLKILKGWGLKKIAERIYYALTKNHRTSCPIPPPHSCVIFLLLYLKEKIYFPFCISSENISKRFYVVLSSLLENEILSFKGYLFRQNWNFRKIITLMSKRITESFIVVFGTYLFLKVRDFAKSCGKNLICVYRVYVFKLISKSTIGIDMKLSAVFVRA